MSFWSKIKDFIATLFASLLTGLCVGILGGLTFMFIRQHPFIALGLSGFFLIFHLDDLKSSWRKKNYLAFAARLLAVFVCIGAPASLVWIAFVTTYSEFRADFFDAAAFVVLIAFFATGLSFTSIVLRFFVETRLGKMLDQILRGSEYLTGLGDFIRFR